MIGRADSAPAGIPKPDRDAKIGVVAVARMTSSRLPGKSMIDINGTPSLGWLVERVRMSKYGRNVTIATTVDSADDPIGIFARQAGVDCHRGSVEDVLGRVHGAARAAGYEVIIHVTGDCPLIAPELIDLAVETIFAEGLDYVILDPEAYPPGMDVEVFSFAALDDVERSHSDPWIREHVTEPLYTTPDRYRAGRVPCPPELNRPHHRITIDTRTDYDLVKAISDQFGPSRRDMSARKICELLDRRPDLLGINSGSTQTKRRAAVIGLGNIGAIYDEGVDLTKGVDSHAGAYVRHGAIHLVAGADPDDAKRARFLENWKIAGVYEWAGELLEKARPEIVSIATPPSSHAALCRAAIEAGVKAIFCEKPFVTDVGEGRALLELANSQNVLIAVNHWMRWSPFFKEVKRAVDDGWFGPVESVRLHYSRGVMNSGTHGFDLLRYLFGEVETVLATGRHDLDPELEEANYDGLLTMTGGLKVIVTTNDYRGHFSFDLDILGSDGRLFIHDSEVHTWRSSEPRGERGYRFLERCESPFNGDNRPRMDEAAGELARFLDTGSGGAACSGADGLRAVEIAYALEESWQTRERINLDLAHA